MKNKKMLSVFILGMIALLGVNFISAYQGDFSIQGPNCSEDRHEAMRQAFDNLDYNAWIALMTEDGRHPRVIDVVTEDNFAIFVEAHEAGEAGNFERTSELRAELGLNNRVSHKDGTGFGGEKGMKRGLMQSSEMRSQNNCHLR